MSKSWILNDFDNLRKFLSLVLSICSWKRWIHIFVQMFQNDNMAFLLSWLPQVGNCPQYHFCVKMMFRTSRLLRYVILPWSVLCRELSHHFRLKQLDRGYPVRIHRWCLVETSSGAWNKRWTERWWWKHVEADFVMISCKRCFPSNSIWSKKVVDWFVVWRAPHFLTPDRPGRWLEDGCSWIEWIEKQRHGENDYIILYLMTHDSWRRCQRPWWWWWWMMMDMDENGAILGFCESLVGCSWPIWMILTYQGQKWFQAEGFLVGRTGGMFRKRCVDGRGWFDTSKKGPRFMHLLWKRSLICCYPMLNPWKGRNLLKALFLWLEWLESPVNGGG